jgi:hypothetical protein
MSLLPDAEAAELAAEVTALRASASTWVAENGPAAVAERATLAKFGDWRGAPLTPVQRARIRAYFGAVLRRSVIHTRDGSADAARRRLLRASIEADLLQAGWSAERALEEALRLTGGGSASSAA